jgi:hypothetical protein
MYPRHLLSKISIALHWEKGNAEYISPEFGTQLINSVDADHARDIRDRRSVSSIIHMINGVVFAYRCKKKATSTLHSTGSEIVSLSAGAKKPIHIRDFLGSVGYPVGEATPIFEDNQATIKSIKASRLHENTRHLATHMSWINECYTMGIIRLLYTNTALQLSDCNPKPLCGNHLQSSLAYVIGVPHYPSPGSTHYNALYISVCRLLYPYLKNGKPIPVTSSSQSP